LLLLLGRVLLILLILLLLLVLLHDPPHSNHPSHSHLVDGHLHDVMLLHLILEGARREVEYH
jgi:hypothetical protein